MSVLDQVRALERQVLQRLRELRPLMAEYGELEKLAERLGLKRDDEEREAGATVQPKPSPPHKRSARPAAKRGATRPPAKRAAVRKPTASAAA